MRDLLTSLLSSFSASTGFLSIRSSRGLAFPFRISKFQFLDSPVIISSLAPSRFLGFILQFPYCRSFLSKVSRCYLRVIIKFHFLVFYSNRSPISTILLGKLLPLKAYSSSNPTPSQRGHESTSTQNAKRRRMYATESETSRDLITREAVILLFHHSNYETKFSHSVSSFSL